MGHETVLASLTLFGHQKEVEDVDNFLRFDREYLFVENIDQKSEEAEELHQQKSDLKVFALLEFEKPVVIAPKSKGDSSDYNP